MRTPKTVSSLILEGTCASFDIRKCEQLMAGATRANRPVLNQLVKKHLPELYRALSLDLYNPYDYFKTKTHLILVHSAIEYFLRYKV